MRTSLARVVVVTPYHPSPVGHGGNHRSYQIRYDAEQAVGASSVATLCLDEWIEGHPVDSSPPPTRPVAARVRASLSYRWDHLSQNPLRAFARTAFTARARLHPAFVGEYKRLLRASEGPVICVSEHPMFETIREVNATLGIPTILCSHNLDALSQNLRALADPEDTSRGRWTAYAALGDFANEIRAMRRYDSVLLISKAEVGTTGGLGLQTQYYPYVPVGEISQLNEQLRRRRERVHREPGLFVLMGSARHYPTRKSLEWFVGNACRYGLTPGTRVAVVGYDTDTLAHPGELPSGVELSGWLRPKQLEELLARAVAVLVPQRLGFGALTRLPELACAGIPALTTAYPTYAMDPTPGVRVVEGEWAEWREAMSRAALEQSIVPESQYRCWEAQQRRTLHDALRRCSAPAETVRG